MGRFARIESNRLRFPELNPFFCESRALKDCESQVWDDSGESLAPRNSFFFFCESIRANRFALRIAGPSKNLNPNYITVTLHNSWGIAHGRFWGGGLWYVFPSPEFSTPFVSLSA